MDDLELTLTRSHTGPGGTFGRLTGAGLSLHTLELPWRDNRTGVSCIPTGVYRGAHHSSAAYPDHYRLLNVQGREGILIHAGNTVKDTQGCILVGLRAGRLDGQPAVLRSKEAMKLLRAKLGRRAFTLGVIDETST